MQLNLSQTIVNKLNYFLYRFKSKEWSGPAWYAVSKQDKHGFPEVLELVDFHPLDLGGSASTEWDAGDLASILKAKYKANEKLKLCYMGLVHSHHDMGAYFSGTDESTLVEMAPEESGFYPSLVVSHKAGKEYAFAVSYHDQYKKSSIVEGKVTLPKTKITKDWIDIGNEIEENAKAITTVIPNNYGYGSYQGTMWENHVDDFDEETLSKGRDVWSKYRNPQNTMTHGEMTAEMKKLKITNPHAVFGGTGWNY